MGIMKKKVAAYIRVSTDSSDQENSYEIQERHFNQLLSGNAGWVSAGIYSDYGLSGTNGEKRTGFRRLLRHCREGRIDRVVCKSISRFARNTSDFMSALKMMSDYDVTILFEKEALDTAEPASAFILTTLGAIAQEESRSISENIRWGMEKRFPRGDVRNQKLYGYHYSGEVVTTESGYQYKAIEIVEEEAAVVRRIFQLVAGGVPYKKIARLFNIEGIPAPVSFYTEKRKSHAVRGQLYSNIEEGWTARHISQIVRRERYAGDVLIQKTYTLDYLTHQIKQNKGEVTQYLVENHHPAIISRGLYEKAQSGIIYPSESGRKVMTQKYSIEFKEEAYKRVLSGVSAAQVVRELGINVNTLYTWLSRFKEHPAEPFVGSGNLRQEDVELRALKKCIRDLEEGNEFLKKQAPSLPRI